MRPICRPGENQQVVYNGHKRVHALKYQSVALPNSMIANMYAQWVIVVFFYVLCIKNDFRGKYRSV